MDSKQFLCTQHLPGKYNYITNMLSFEGEVWVTRKLGIKLAKENPLTKDKTPNDILTQRILSFLPQMVPDGFQICHLDDKTFSCGVFGDLEKAFYTVNHKIILDKRNHIGITNQTNKQ